MSDGIIYWQKENPELLNRIRNCGNQLQRLNQAILEKTMDELEELDNDFEMLEFSDRIAQRLGGFNLLNQMLAQLGGNYVQHQPARMDDQAVDPSGPAGGGTAPRKIDLRTFRGGTEDPEDESGSGEVGP